MPRPCPNCGFARFEFDPGAGHSFCLECGVVVEENAIVSEVTFGETAGGAAIVQGSHVAAGATHARMSGPFGRKDNTETRNQAMYNAKQVLQGLRSRLGIGEAITNAAERWFSLCYDGGFTKGRRRVSVVAACCYVAVRQATKPIMLIDLSDLLQVSVFELGGVYLQLLQNMRIRNLPLVDPEFYIERFSRLLEFGADREKIRDEAIRIVHRFKRDWLHTGRRPSGICGAALLLAARMNNYRRSVLEVVQVVKIADTTLKKRLEEFRATPSANFSVEEFRQKWLDQEENPPAYTKGLVQVEGGKENKKGSKKRKREAGDDGEIRISVSPTTERSPLRLSDQSARDGTPSRTSPGGSGASQDPTGDLSFERIVGSMGQAGQPPEPLFLPDDDQPNTRNQDGDQELDWKGDDEKEDAQPEDLEPLIEDAMGKELNEYLDSAVDDAEIQRGLALAEEVERLRLARMTSQPQGDELQGLDEAELDMYIMTEQEVKAKERVWVELNREYLEKIAAQQAAAQGDAPVEPKKPTGKKRPKLRDSTTARGATPAESVMHILQRPGKKGVVAKSKRINYDALQALFADDRISPADRAASSARDDSVMGEGKDFAVGSKEGFGDEEEMEMELIEEEDVGGFARMPLQIGEPDEYGYGDDSYVDEGGWEEEA